MSKRNLILIIIGIVIILIVVFAFWSFSPTNNTGTNTGGTNFLSQLFPFGKTNPANPNKGTTPANISGFNPTGTGTAPQELLARVSSMPIAGYGSFMEERYTNIGITTPTQNPSSTLPLSGEGDNSISPTKGNSGGLTTPTSSVVPTPPTTEFAPALRYVERATGNIYETFADKISERKLTTTVIPEVHDAYFGTNAESVAMRYLKEDENTIETFVGTLPKEIFGQNTTNSDLTGSFLPENITTISLSPDNSSMFYLFDNGDTATGIIASSFGNGKNQIFSSPFTEWLSGWPNDRMIALTTKPSANVPGFMYSLDPNLKKMTKILSGVNGMTTLTSPSGKLVLYNDNSLNLRIYNTDTQNSTSIGIRTLPEKCVWDNSSVVLYCAVPNYVNGSNFPDDWYQGETSFSDQLWKVNTENGEATILADPASFPGGEDVDGIKLSLDQNGDYLFFMNKKDSSLWELKLQ